MTDTASLKVARRILATRDPHSILLDIRNELRKMQAWSRTFVSTFKDSQKNSSGAPAKHVWQDEWVDFWSPFGPIQKELFSLEGELERVSPALGLGVDDFVEPPKAARIEEAINDPKFAKRKGKDHIAYSEKSLLDWHRAFVRWVDYALKGVDRMIKENR